MYIKKWNRASQVSESLSACKSGAARDDWREQGEINADLRHDLFQGLDGFLQRYLVWVVVRRVLFYVCGRHKRSREEKSLSETEQKVEGEEEWRWTIEHRQCVFLYEHLYDSG